LGLLRVRWLVERARTEAPKLVGAGAVTDPNPDTLAVMRAIADGGPIFPTEAAIAADRLIEAGREAGRLEERQRHAALVEAASFALNERHPMQYGFVRLPDGRETATTHMDDPHLLPREIYARCPTCEEWAPCSVRKALAALEEAGPVEGVPT